jgi:TctA family transporter
MEDPLISNAASETLTIVFSIIAILALATLGYGVHMQANVQPIKIKSPKLILLFIFANILAILLLCIVQLNEDKCIQNTVEIETCKKGALLLTAQICGYLFVCFVEPLIMMAFLIRYMRITKIFEAQQIYFENN